MLYRILVTKETRAGELRVSLIPRDVKQLVLMGHQIFVEHDAGVGAGFSDEAYQQAGATIRNLADQSLMSYQNLFHDINLVLRAKRPDRAREQLENQVISPNTIMVGALDPLELQAPHLAEYQKAGIIMHSIDQLALHSDDPMNILAAMSKIAGRLALLDGIQKCSGAVEHIVIIGFGAVGRSAFEEAIKKGISTTVLVSNDDAMQEIKALGGHAVKLDREISLAQQQAVVKQSVVDAEVIIACARKPNQPAPRLIPLATMQSMRSGAVIVDMALSEGGNVEGSEHDATHVMGNEVLVTNTSGYPKILPQESSPLWSTASMLFIIKLSQG